MAETSTSTTKAKAKAEDDLGLAEVQAAVDQAQQQGYFGTVPDETPNRNYTVAGVTEGAPTPESERRPDARLAVPAAEGPGAQG